MSTVSRTGSVIALLAVTLSYLPQAAAVPLNCSPALLPAPGPGAIYCGTDAGNTDTNSNAAFAAWSAAVGTFDLENLDDASAAANVVTTGSGNTFSAVDTEFLSVFNFSFQVLQGNHLRLNGPAGVPNSFTWTLPSPVASFGFFGRSNAGSVISVAFGSSESPVDFLAGPGGNDNLFIGIHNAAAPISSVTVTTTDSDSRWDRFAYAEASSVPVPASLALLGVGLVLLRNRAPRNSRS